MSSSFILLLLIALTIYGYALGRRRMAAAGRGKGAIHSLPEYYGYYVALWCGLPAFILILAWTALEPRVVEALILSGLPDRFQALSPSELSLVWTDIRNLATGSAVSQQPEPALVEAATRLVSLQGTAGLAKGLCALALGIAGLVFARTRLSPQLRARPAVEKTLNGILIVASLIAILTTVGIVLSVLGEALRFFARVPVTDFLFGTTWSPQTAIRADQVGSSGAFGAVPLFTGTLLITVIAMAVAVPIGLMSAIYMADYATPRFRSIAKPALEVLAGIPTVVYGFFAALTVAPFIRDLGADLGLNVASESALAAGVVMGIMIVPFISSLTDDVIHAVPQSLRHGAYGLGATRSETIRQVVLPAALPGIVAAIMLAVSRAIGETMIVAMAAGLAANLSFNPLEAVTTVTVQIATLLVGDQEFDSPKTLAAFALGLVLFAVTLMLNVIALRVVHKYREKYD